MSQGNSGGAADLGTEAAMRRVWALDDEAARDGARMGNKAAGLARLHAAGLPVPPGFVVAVAPAVDEGWREEVRAAYAELCGELTPDPAGKCQVAVAVRSSSPHEDQADRSAASVLPSKLGVRGIAQIEQTIAELRHPAAWERLGRYAVGVFGFAGPAAADAPAVIVQALVRADAAGVTFTAHPVTGSRERVLIEVGSGLGDMVTDGLLVPTMIEVGRIDGQVVAERPGVQRTMHAFDEEAGGLTERRTAEGAPTLSAAEARAVWAAALAAEELFGGPVDVEWAIEREASDAGDPAPGAGGHRLWIVQARPITTLPT